jgi:hypothetical protein
MKKDVKEVIQGEEPHLNNLLSQETNVSNRNRGKVFCVTR